MLGSWSAATEFGAASFERGADFRLADFSASTGFRGAQFAEGGNFRLVRLRSESAFDETSANGPVDFGAAILEGEVSLSNLVSSASLSLEDVFADGAGWVILRKNSARCEIQEGAAAKVFWGVEAVANDLWAAW